jgi:hypothetical protein
MKDKIKQQKIVVREDIKKRKTKNTRRVSN